MDYALVTHFPTQRDGKWHHGCVNLDDALDIKFGSSKTHVIDAVIWHRPGVLAPGKYSKRRRSNVAVIFVESYFY